MIGTADKSGHDAMYTENENIKISEVSTVSSLCREPEMGTEETHGELVVFMCFVCVHVFILALAACCVHPVYSYDIDIAIWWFRC